MSIEDDIYFALKGLVGGRVERDVARSEGILKPYITFQQVGGVPLNYLEPVLPNKRNGRFRVSVWDTTRDGASEIARQAERALVESSVLLATTETGLVARPYEPETGLYGTWQDFSIWFNT